MITIIDNKTAEPLKLYHCRTLRDIGYDEYDSCVVIAENKEIAMKHASERCDWNVEDVVVKIVGLFTGELSDYVNPNKKIGMDSYIVCSSFNAG